MVSNNLSVDEFENDAVGTVSSPEGFKLHRQFFRPIPYFAVAAATISSFGAHSPLIENSGAIYQISGTGDMMIVARSATTSLRNSALPSRLNGLYAASGLTWGEVASALGVSRRAVHHWLSGQLPSDRHIRRIDELESLVNYVNAGDSRDTRDALTSIDASGTSVLSRFEASSAPRRSVPLSSFTVGEFLKSDFSAEAPSGGLDHRVSGVKGLGKLSREERRE